MKWIVAICLFLLLGCDEYKSNPIVTASEVIQNQGERKLLHFLANEKVEKLVNMGVDSTNGMYSFYPNGHLQHYRFFANNTAYTYSEEYDEIGDLVKMEGNPLVYHSIELVSEDSISCQLFFSTLMKTYQSVTIDANDGQQLNLKLSPDTVFTDVEQATFKVGIPKSGQIIIHAFAKYKMNYDTILRSLKDTIVLKYTPRSI